jgi:hypothetical protein
MPTSAEIRSTASRNAASSAGARPRNPRNSRTPFSDPTISAASWLVTGWSRHAESAITSIMTPPLPQTIT